MRKMTSFAHKMVNDDNSPERLKNQLRPRKMNFTMRLRTHTLNNSIDSRQDYTVETPKVASKVGESTFNYFFAKFITHLVG